MCSMNSFCFFFSSLSMRFLKWAMWSVRTVFSCLTCSYFPLILLTSDCINSWILSKGTLLSSIDLLSGCKSPRESFKEDLPDLYLEGRWIWVLPPDKSNDLLSPVILWALLLLSLGCNLKKLVCKVMFTLLFKSDVGRGISWFVLGLSFNNCTPYLLIIFSLDLNTGILTPFLFIFFSISKITIF